MNKLPLLFVVYLYNAKRNEWLGRSFRYWHYLGIIEEMGVEMKLAHKCVNGIIV